MFVRFHRQKFLLNRSVELTIPYKKGSNIRGVHTLLMDLKDCTTS